MAELDYKIETVDSLGEETVPEMFALYCRYFDGTNERIFRSDLANKQYVIVLRNRQGTLQGFSTAVVAEHRFGGKLLREFFSGDTIVDERYWGQQTLSTAWLSLTASIKADAPEVPLYWFLMVKGHRTYRYLRAFFKVFFPAYDRETPPDKKALMDMLAQARFGNAYHRDRRVVSFPTSHGHLKPSWAEIPEKDRHRSDVAFFLEHNPGYAQGDELVCLTEISSTNLKPFGERMFRDGTKIGN
jgi:hypothetical protein